MYVSVDVVAPTKIEGFSYINSGGYEEKVKLDGDDMIIIEDDGGCTSYIFIEDIPKLIKALEAAYKHVNGLDNTGVGYF